MAFSGLAKVVDLRVMQLVSTFELLLRRSLHVKVAWMIHPLALREDSIRELFRNWDGEFSVLLPCSIGGRPVTKYANFRIVLIPGSCTLLLYID